MRAQIAASLGLFALNWEIPVCAGCSCRDSVILFTAQSKIIRFRPAQAVLTESPGNAKFDF
jgi:hypothetical protein